MKTSFTSTGTLTVRGLVAALMLAASQLASAHAYPTHETPGAGATVATTQQNVAIDYDDGLEPAFSSITVTDAQGKSVTRGKSVVDPANNRHMSVVLNPLAPGVYSVAWVAIATDSHRTQGHYTFTAK
ncbi:copper resistance protein [Burkholderia sp. WAC0059]|uniref:copper resistance CopC family protein n=1 Tax=Burkholderia sp. WAC0059 TaxID=2066022 RepID=UPI000C7EF182|nr:copper resistance protein CopC [Burkholderia sp. WAC0059]PLZ02208.1 copper resistance protein [Burkholderia sp. WAC0059]